MRNREIEIHQVLCMQPQERTVISDGDEIRLRLTALNGCAFFPEDQRSYSRAKAGSRIDTPGFSLRHEGSATLDLFDVDGLPWSSARVEERSSDHLGEYVWDDLDQPVEGAWIHLIPGPKSAGAEYKLQYSLRILETVADGDTD